MQISLRQPEQAAADPNIDHRADIYSVGVLAYEMLAGRNPFRRDSTFETLHAIYSRDCLGSIVERVHAIVDNLNVHRATDVL